MADFEENMYVNPMELRNLQNETEQKPNELKNDEVSKETLKTIENLQRNLRSMWLFLFTLLLIMAVGFVALYFSISAKLESTKGVFASQQLLTANQQSFNDSVQNKLSAMADSLARQEISATNTKDLVQNQLSAMADSLARHEMGATNTKETFQHNMSNVAEALQQMESGFSQQQETLQHNMSNLFAASKQMESGFLQLQDNLTRSSLLQSASKVQCPIQSHLFGELLSSSASRIFPRSLTSYYKFAYDSSNNYSIGDGGGDMYDGGNKLRVGQYLGSIVQVIYNWTYCDPNGQYFLTCKASDPFVFSMLVLNRDGATRRYFMEEKSDLGADGGGNYKWNSGSLTVGSYNIKYVLYQVYGAGDPSIIQIYFTASSPKLGSSGSSSLSSVDNQQNTVHTDNEVTLTGTAHNVYFNYILTSKSASSSYVSTSTIEGILRSIFEDL